MGRRVAIASITATAAFALDWASKAWAVDMLAATDLYFNDRSVQVWILAPLLVVVCTLLALCSSRITAIGIGITVGAWAANCIDRQWRGPVTDFLSVGDVVFNLADVLLVIGFLVIVTGFAPWLVTRIDRSCDRSHWLPSLALAAAVLCIDWTAKGLAVQLLDSRAISYADSGGMWLMALIAIVPLYACCAYWRPNIAATLALAGALGAAASNSTALLSERGAAQFIPTGTHISLSLADIATACSVAALVLVATPALLPRASRL